MADNRKKGANGKDKPFRRPRKKVCTFCVEHIDEIDYKDVEKLKRFVTIDYIKDTNKVLQPKMSPVDMGKDSFLKLYNERIRI